jgi:predicted acetyltransferase
MEFRTIEPDEFTAFLTTLARAFSDTQPDPMDLVRDTKLLQPDRVFAAVDEGAIVGCAAGVALQMVVPGGGVVDTAGVTVVGVLPTHRRRGITRELLGRVLAQASERDESLAALLASEGAIYGRFGFGPAISLSSHDIDVDRAGPPRADEGRVRLLDHREAVPLLGRVYTAAQRPGFVRLDDVVLEWLFTENPDVKERPLYAVHEDAEGEPDAFALYRAKHEWPQGLPTVEVEVQMLVAATDAGYAAIWRYLFDIDLVHRLKVEDRPVDEPLRLMVSEGRALRTSRSDGLYARPVDVSRTLRARSYGVDGRLLIGVRDPFMPANGGVYELAADAGGVDCRPVVADPEISCEVTAIGAVYFGETSWSMLAAAGLAEEHTGGAIARADAMFASTETAWSPFFF